MSEAALRRDKITREDLAAYPPYPADWYIEDEEQVPESRPHDLEGDHLRQLFLAWKTRIQHRLAVGRNIAVRWDESHPGVGVDPDVYIIEDPPADFDNQPSLRTWESGHYPPLLAVEIVSESRPEKDYTQSPPKYATNGTRELWIFDPKMCRAKKHGKPIRLQVWRRDENGDFSCVYAGEGPVYSDAISAWIFVTNEGQNLNIANDAEGTSWWMTPAEQEREAKLQERAAKEKERTAKEAALKQLDDERIAKEQERIAKEHALKQIDDERIAKEHERIAKEHALKQIDDERIAKDTALKQLDDERVAKEQERVAKEQELARIAELEALFVKGRA